MVSSNFQSLPLISVALGSALGKVTANHLKQELSPPGLRVVGGALRRSCSPSASPFSSPFFLSFPLPSPPPLHLSSFL